jgi:Rod binding domain-containing protein
MHLAQIHGTGYAGTASAHRAAVMPQPRLVHAAHEFEAQMMTELLKPMTQSDGLTGDAADSSSGSGGALSEFASDAFGRALSEQGGFGIATSIVRSLSHSGRPSQSVQGTEDQRGDPPRK